MKRIIICLIICTTVDAVSLAQTTAPADSLTGATILSKRTDAAMQKRRDNRFGQFIH